MIRAFNATDKIYNNNGDAVIAATKARVKNEDNGDFTLDLICSSEYNDYIQANNIIVVSTPGGDQAFRIRQVEKRGNKIEAKCFHVFYDAANYIIADSYAVNMTAKQALEHFNAATDNTSPFKMDSDINTINNLRIVRDSLAEAVIEVIERWSGHLIRDNYNIAIKNNIGRDNGITIDYKKNLKELTASYDWSNVATKLLPVGKDGVVLNDLYVYSATQYDIPFTKTVSFQQDLEREDYPSDEAYLAALRDDLKQQAEDYLAAACVPNINYTLKGNPEKVTDIGDIIEVRDARIGVNVLTKVIAYEYDCIANKYVSLEFGNFTPKLSSLMSNIKSDTSLQIANATSTINTEVNALGNAVTIINNHVNELDSGKQDKLTPGENINITNNVISAKDTQYEAGENISIENNIISASGVNVLYGEDAPENDDIGKNKDFYLVIKEATNSVLLETDYTTDATDTNPISVTSFTRKSALEYDFDITGKPASGYGEKLYYNLHGLIEGNTYTINFKGKYSDGTTFPYYPQYNAIFAVIIDGVQTSVIMPSDTLIHDNTITFVAGTENKLFYYLSSADGVFTTLSITDFEIDGATFSLGDIENIYNKYNGMWKKYTPKGASSISELTDVELTDLANKDILEWDNVAEKWKNKPNSGGNNGNFYGAFIDTQRVIQASKAVSAGTTDIYVPTVDCAIQIVFVGSTNPSRAYIDGVEIETHYVNTLAFVTHVIYVKAGQEFSLLSGDNSTNYTVYGLTYGSEIFAPIIYSEEEREVGVWIDNKPLYAKSFQKQLTPNSANIDISDLDIENGWVYDGFYDIGVTNLGLNENISNNIYTWTHLNNGLNPPYIDCFCVGFNNSIVYLTILYTKTTDVAGSGKYNTLGVPTIHYTTDEQVIGTWTDGKPLYQKTLKSNSGIAQNSWTSIINDSSIRIKNYYGYIYYTANLEDGVKYPLDWTRVANSAYSCSECNGGDLEVIQKIATSYGYDVTIQYTKTTD